jgi:hypothetical protein
MRDRRAINPRADCSAAEVIIDQGEIDAGDLVDGAQRGAIESATSLQGYRLDS